MTSRMRRSRVVAGASALGFGLAGVALLTCTTSPTSQTPVFVSASSSIVLSADEQSLWVASPDDNSLVQIAADTLAVMTTVTVSGAPQQLAWVGGRLVATLAQTPAVAVVDTRADGGNALTLVAVPCGATRAVIATGATSPTTALVSCPDDDRGRRTRHRRWSKRFVRSTSPGRPTSLAIAGNQVAITAARIGPVRVIALERLEATPAGATTCFVTNDSVLVDDLTLAPGDGVSALRSSTR